MRVIFAGTPEFAATALKALLAQPVEVVAVLTQPDRPSGRGMHLLPSPVKQLALEHGLPVWQPPSLKPAEIQDQLAALNADLMVVAAYGLILPKAVLEMPRKGCLNIHASLLPRWRGAAPIQRAILAGDAETGITIMQMDEGLDTGAMLLSQSCAIAPDDTAATLHDKLALMGGELIVSALQLAEKNQLQPRPQDSTLATYAAKLSKAEGRLDWQQDASQLARAVRAYQPFPVASAMFGETPLKIWKASECAGKPALPGMVLSVGPEAIVVACGKDALQLQTLQRPGGKPLPCQQFLQGFQISPGECFS